MNTFLGIILGLVVLMLLVVAHEFGHFIAARRNGVWVEEFGIGFPPRGKAWLKNPDYDKWKKAKKEAKKSGKKFDEKKPKKWLPFPKSEWGKPQKTLVFSINLLPIGGFCQMKGESDSDKRPESFGQATFWQKTKILFAGVAMNWLAAFVILTTLALTGMPHFIENQFTVENDVFISAKPVTISEVKENSPAYYAGLKEDDVILEIDGQKILSATDVVNYNNAHTGQTVEYTVVSSEDTEEFKEAFNCWRNETANDCKNRLNSQIKHVTLNESGAEYILGVAMNQDQSLYRSTWSAPIVGAVTTLQLTGETFKGLGTAVYNLFSGIFKQFSSDETVREEGKTAIGTAGDSVSGPVGILGVVFPAFVDAGWTNIMFLAALISVSLACMNVLPIPALDGGRWFLIALFRIRKKTLTKETEEKIVGRAFTFLLLFIVFITILDVIRMAK